MKNYILLVLLALAGWNTSLLAQASCDFAPSLTVDTFTVEVIHGDSLTSDCTTFENGSKANWYSYVSNEEEQITISSSLPASAGVDTRLSVVAGSCAGFVCVGGNDDIPGGGSNSSFSFTTIPGITYYVVWDNRWADTGFQFYLSSDTVPVVERLVEFTSMGYNPTGNTYGTIDMNGDFLDDIVSVGNQGVNVNYQNEDGTFTAAFLTTQPLTNFPDWSMAAADYDGNGYNDLLFGDGSAVSFLRANDNGTLMLEIAFDEYVFSQRSNFIDINNDGNLDAFVCHDVAPNVYFINDGENNLEFNQGTLGDTPNGGNYGSVWIDFDNDRDQDLFIAKCRGGGSNIANINQLHINNGDGTFTEVAEDYNLADNIQTWSSAWGDFDNDGDLDVFVGASSFNNGGHKLMRNDGDTFVDVTPDSGLDNLNSTSIETKTHDFNNDGYLDLLNGGRDLMVNNGDWTFTKVNISPNHGPVGDLNNDGFLDVVNGGTIHLNRGNDNNHLTVHTVGTVSNINGIGARIEVYSALGQQIREVSSGTGFRYMSSLNAHFGLGEDESIDKVVVRWPSGIVDEILAPEINNNLMIVEGSFPSSTRNLEVETITLYPNPARELVTLDGDWDQEAVAKVFDLNGRLVLTSTLQNNSLPVNQLLAGSYLIILENNGKLHLGRMIKQ